MWFVQADADAGGTIGLEELYEILMDNSLSGIGSCDLLTCVILPQD